MHKRGLVKDQLSFVWGLESTAELPTWHASSARFELTNGKGLACASGVPAPHARVAGQAEPGGRVGAHRRWGMRIMSPLGSIFAIKAYASKIFTNF